MIERFGRVRLLVHYWRLLHLHHAQDLRRKASRLHDAFSGYLGVSISTIKADLALIEQRLGDGWDSQPMPLTFRP